MKIETKINKFPRSAPVNQFPLLRQLVPANDVTLDQSPLVILFTEEHRGTILSGTEPRRIGKSETWASCLDEQWIPTSITLTSTD